MGSNPSTESNYKTAVNSKNKMQMVCIQPGTTAEGYNQGREPKNSMHSSTEICNRICGHASHSTHRGNESAESPLALASWNLLPKSKITQALTDNLTSSHLIANSTNTSTAKLTSAIA
ncbi:phytoene synthase [Dorcoceras hygrometricum]|uniref:Phytoene synthase n=1 Tax=Dorcoceras hygrometricum TaxID=472368 RepID=A0A2Z7AFV0_9LAMI|nr:phytoene synthase [Dorcoceras hygrometricum]